MNEKLYQINNVYHKYKQITKSTIKHIKYKRNEQQYIDMGRLERCQAVNIGRPVQFQGPLPLPPKP